MRICLFCNETAGEGVSAGSLAELIHRAGHDVERVVDNVGELRRHLASRLDCVVAAGGDGTVAKVGRALAGGQIPLAILPLGTANNIASSLAIRGEPEQLIARWNDQRIVRIDIGRVDFGSGQCCFLESIGTGLVVEGIAEGSATLSKDDPVTHLKEARQLYAGMILGLQPHRVDLTIDGHEFGGEYLLIEVLNTPSIGPGIRLSENVSAADGWLSVVAARESDRDQLTNYMQRRLIGEPADAGLKSWPARRVELRGAREYHVDDKVMPADGVVSIAIAPAFLQVLA